MQQQRHLPQEPFSCREPLLWEGFVTPILAEYLFTRMAHRKSAFVA